MLFDTHCHLDVAAFDNDREDVYARARAAHVTRFLNPAYDLESSRRAIKQASGHPEVYAAVGIHPNDIGSFSKDTIAELIELSKDPKVVAVGEIGLDYYWKTFTPEQQQQAFRDQLQMARRLNLPVIIHCRDAYDDTLDILASSADGIPVLLHSFAGATRHAERALRLGYYFGIGGPVTFKNAASLRTAVSSIPLDRIMLETDSPYLAPQPHRGKRNEPSLLPLIAQRVADIHQVDLTEAITVTATTACTYFGLT